MPVQVANHRPDGERTDCQYDRGVEGAIQQAVWRCVLSQTEMGGHGDTCAQQQHGHGQQDKVPWADQQCADDQQGWQCQHGRVTQAFAAP